MPETTTLAGASRILLHGVTGSGKSSLAAVLSRELGCPWVDMDHLAWRPGWTEAGLESFRADVEDAAAGESWVMDTAYTRVRDLVLPRVDVVVALDYPRHVVTARLLRRTARRVLLRERVCHGNVETLRRALGRESILLWQHRSFRRKREATRAMCVAPTGPPVLVLRSPREADRLVASLRP